MKRINLLIIIFFLLLASCTREKLDIFVYQTKEVTAHFSFTMAQMQNKVIAVSTRSTPSSTVDNSQITDLWVVQFDNNGNFLKKSYYTAILPTVFDVLLVPNVAGATSNLYFLANIGSALASPTNENAFMTQVKNITNESDLLITGSNGKKNIPMVGILLTQSVPSSGYITTMNIILTRLLAEVDLTYTVDASLTSTFILEKIRVCNVPKTIQYYNPGVGSFPVTPSATTVLNFEYEAATTPGASTITFYLPDNHRGTGTNSIGTDSRLKSGVNFATYIELVGHTKGAQGGDEVSYRIYPGTDTFNDYNIVRNTYYSLSTTIKGFSVLDKRVRIKERSNCYIVSPGGSVNIPVKHANDAALGTQIADVTTGTWTPSINWQTTDGLVTIDNSKSALGYFKVTAPSTTVKGNAEVMIKDGSGNVLWSWHIWITDYEPETSNDILNGNTWMKCNLGATDQGVLPYNQTAGMSYQWGRKDPFPPSNTTGNNVAPITISGFTIPSYTGLTTTGNSYVKYVDASQSPVSYIKQLAYSVKYPMLFFYKWSGSTATAAADNITGINSWGGEYGQSKSVYDPCPEGWRVPSGKKTSNYWNSPWSTYTYSGITTGVSWTVSNTNYGIWSNTGIYPVPGYRRNNDASLWSVGSTGYYWASTASNADGYALYLNYYGTDPSNSLSRAYGNSVRCVKEW